MEQIIDYITDDNMDIGFNIELSNTDSSCAEDMEISDKLDDTSNENGDVAVTINNDDSCTNASNYNSEDSSDSEIDISQSTSSLQSGGRARGIARCRVRGICRGRGR